MLRTVCSRGWPNGLSIFVRNRLIWVSTTVVRGSKCSSHTPLEQHGTCDDPPLIAHQNLKQGELARLKIDRLARAGYPPTDKVEFEIEHPEDLQFVLEWRPA